MVLNILPNREIRDTKRTEEQVDRKVSRSRSPRRLDDLCLWRLLHTRHKVSVVTVAVFHGKSFGQSHTFEKCSEQNNTNILVGSTRSEDGLSGRSNVPDLYLS